MAQPHFGSIEAENDPRTDLAKRGPASGVFIASVAISNRWSNIKSHYITSNLDPKWLRRRTAIGIAEIQP